MIAIADGDYTLTIAPRLCGLISASSGDPFNRNREGDTGDDFLCCFSKANSDQLITISSEITELQGRLSNNATALANGFLRQGRQLPGNFNLSYQDEGKRTITYSASGYMAVASGAIYGSLTLIQVTAASAAEPSLNLDSDPSWAVIAFSGECIGIAAKIA